MNGVLLTFVFLLVLKWAVNFYLDLLNRNNVITHADSVPESFRSFMDEETYRKSVDYTLAKIRFGFIESGYGNIILLILILSGLLVWLFQVFSGVFGTSIWGQSTTLIIMGFVLSVPELPFEWWTQFRLEEKFGFNKSSVGLWLKDKIKGLLIGLIIGFPLLSLVLWLVSFPFWWLWAAVVMFLFQLLMIVIYPQWIMPLFNKFEPLPKGELRDRLMGLSDRTGFKAKTIMVMDGSKRSSHSNAFFTGFGKFRRIILFDTLIEQLTVSELEAVLAHEIGHYRLGHIPKMFILSAVSTFVGFAVLGYLADAGWFLQGFGFPSDAGIAAVLLLFALVSGIITFWLTPFMSRWSRKHEYEADHFAREAVEGPNPLIGALRKLHEKNLSNMTPHPLYSRFHYSHPTLIERETALKEN